MGSNDEEVNDVQDYDWTVVVVVVLAKVMMMIKMMMVCADVVKIKSWVTLVYFLQ